MVEFLFGKQAVASSILARSSMDEIKCLLEENATLKKELQRAEEFNRSANRWWKFRLERVQLSLDGAFRTIRDQNQTIESARLDLDNLRQKIKSDNSNPVDENPVDESCQ